MTVIIGTAGWTIPTESRDGFPGEGSSLERYAARFRGAEINSSFHRPHRIEIYARWAAMTPAGFRFAVKVPKTITHEHGLVACEALIARFADAQAAAISDLMGEDFCVDDFLARPDVEE